MTAEAPPGPPQATPPPPSSWPPPPPGWPPPHPLPGAPRPGLELAQGPQAQEPSVAHRSAEGTGRKAQGAAGGIGAALFAALKYGAVALKFGKFGPMVISMALSVGVLALLEGWKFGVGLVALILVHEMGHVLFARIEGVTATLPIFLGPFGAFIQVKSAMRDARQEAVIAIGGPLMGTAGAMVCAIVAGNTAGSTQRLFVALTYFGFFLNLFNLTPMLPFDGGRVAGAVSVWLNVLGVGVMGYLLFLRLGVGANPLLVLLFILGCITTFQRFRHRRELTYLTDVPPRVRAMIGLSWITLIAVTAIGMSIAHQRLIELGSLSPVN